jgi:predicted DNA-binding transcriptional regulator AlpA
MISLLTEAEAANMLKIKTRTLSKMRREGNGPTFLRIGGSIRYETKDVLEWVYSQKG